MTRQDIDYAVIAALVLSGLYSAITGLLADMWGLHQVALHAEAGYVSAGLALAHLTLNRQRVGAYIRRRFRAGSRRVDIQATPECRTERPLPALRRRQVIGSAIAAGAGFLAGVLIPRRSRTDAPEGASDLGALYHEWSKPGYAQLLGGDVDWGTRPSSRKSYPEAPRRTLPDPGDSWGSDLAEVLLRRRSVRKYTGEPLSMEALSCLLHSAQGITDPRGLRASPSAGALYPIEVYVVVHNVSNVESGLYHYVPEMHQLEVLQTGNLRSAIQEAGLWQDFLADSAVCLVLSAVFQRTRWRYRERTYRYVMLEAGHIGQNVYLAATALGLGACAVGAFHDDELNRLLGLDGKQEAALYIMSVGRP